MNHSTARTSSPAARGVRRAAAAVLGLALTVSGVVVLTAAPAVAAVEKPFSNASAAGGYSATVYGDFLQGGNGNVRCPNTNDRADPNNGAPTIASCSPTQGRNGAGNNDNYFMRWNDTDGVASTFNNSTAQVTVPPGATVEYARLLWSGDTGVYKVSATDVRGTASGGGGTDTRYACGSRQYQGTGAASSPVPAGSPESTSVGLAVNGAAAVAHAASGLVRDATATLPNNSPQYYSASADVTDQLAAAPTGSALSLTTTDLWTPEGFGCYAGWSLVVVYAYPTVNPTYAPSLRDIDVYVGHIRQANGNPDTTTTITGFRAPSTDARVGITAYEGDFNISGDQLLINGTAQAEPSSSGTTPNTSNFFLSSADGATSPSVANNFSVDTKKFTTASIPSGSTSADVTLRTTGDSYLAQSIVLSIPRAEITFTKQTPTHVVRPGDTVTFDITATNPTNLTLHGVAVHDPDYATCDRTIGTLDPQTTVQYQCQVAAGDATFTNSATVQATETGGDPGSGGDTIPSSAQVRVIHPALSVTTTADRASYTTTQVPVFTVTVQNTGDAPLSDVAVRDPEVSDCTRSGLGTLAAGAALSYTCSGPTAAQVSPTTTATATGTDETSRTVTAAGRAAVVLDGTVTGTVFADSDTDGRADGRPGAGEGGVAGVTITLTDSSGGTRTTTTGADGTYTFADVVPGTYTVTETQPAGYTDGADTPGTNATAAGNDAVTVTVASGGGSGGTTFAELPSGSLHGTVFTDTNGNGTQDADEPGIRGVALQLTGTDSGGQAVSRTVTSGDDGTYTVASLRAPDANGYTLRETPPDGYLDGADTAGTAGGTVATPSSADTVSAITPTDGQLATGYTFAEARAASISGTTRTDTGAPLAGVTVTVTDAAGNVVGTTTSAGDGSYTVGSLEPGTDTVTETQPTGYGDGTATVGDAAGTAGTNATTGINLTSGQAATGYGFTDTTATVSGFVYRDANDDGKRTGDPGTSDVLLTLGGTASDGSTVSLTARSLADGSYAFPGLRAGRYTVTETQPVDLLDGLEGQGPAAGTEQGDVLPVTLTAGSASAEQDFGELDPAQITVRALLDDGSETPLPGTVVTLTGTDDRGAQVSTVGRIRPSGRTLFENLRPGTYTLTETQPTGYADGRDVAGDRGAVTANDVISGITLLPGDASGGHTFSERAGSLTGSVYDDANGNGVRNAGEQPIPGVTVTLGGAATATTTTSSADGSYTFGDLAAGSYTITEAQPAGYVDGQEGLGNPRATQPADDVLSVDLPAGVAGTGYTFGESVAATVSGTVRDDQGRPLAGVGVTVQRVDGTGAPVGDPVVVTSGPDGTFSTAGLPSGTYTVTETQPTGYGDGTASAGGTGGTVSGPDTVTGVVVGSGATVTGIGFTDTTGSISGFAYHDANDDGVAQRDEARIPIRVRLLDAQGGTVATVDSQDGTYTFAGLVAGTYTVSETQPLDYLDGQDTVGTAGGTLDPPDQVIGIQLGAGTSATGYLFGEITATGLSGAVRADDVDGTGIAGVTIRVTGTDDQGTTVDVTTTTDAGGSWSLPNLRPGTYTITETQPDGYGPGSAVVGSAGGTASDANTVTGVQLTQSAGTGTVFLDTTGSTSGSVFDDANGDGVRQAGEAGIRGVTVVLTGTDVRGATVRRSATTADDGSYTVSGVVAGTYDLTETQPAGYLDGADAAGTSGGTVTGPDSVTGIPLAAATDATGYTFGETRAATVSGTVVDDRGRPLAGVTVTVQRVDGTGTPVGAPVTVTTGDTGAFSATGLVPGTYTVTETQPAGYGPGTATAGSSGTAVPPNTVTGVTVGSGGSVTGTRFTDATATLSGAVYRDDDGNGVRSGSGSSTEPGIAGVTVRILAPDETVVATTTTAADGSWEVTGLPAGTYTVAETQPTAYGDGAEAFPAGASQDVNDRITTTLGAGATVGGFTFGEVQAAVTGTVYRDTDGSGTRQAGEAGLGPVTLELLDAAGTVVATTSTAADDGRYTFTALVPGPCTVRETQPDGYTSTTPDQVAVTATAGTPVVVDFGERPAQDLAVAITTGTRQVGVGDTVVFTVTTTDRGAADATGAVTTVVLPAGLTPVGVTGDGWTVTVDGRTVTATRTATIPAGTDAPVLLVTTRATTAGLDLTATATTRTRDGAAETTVANNSASAQVTVQDAAVVITPPVGTPPVDGPVSTPTTDPTTGPVPGGAGTTGGGAAGTSPVAGAAPAAGRLARTGADVLEPLWLGLALTVAGGAVLLLAAPRRRRDGGRHRQG